MSVQAITWVLEQSDSRLAARHVLISIANHADREGKNSWPSVETIAFESHLSKREVQRSFKILTESGELEVETGAGPRGTNRYSLPKMSPRQVVTPDKSDTKKEEGGDIYVEKRDQMSPEPSLTVLKENRPKQEQKLFDTAPNWIPVGTWLAFVDMRRKIRKPMTEHAADLIMRRLAELKAEGYDPEEVLNQSIRNSWQDVFEIRRKSGDGSKTAAEKNHDTTARALSRVFSDVVGDVSPDLSPTDRGTGSGRVPGGPQRLLGCADRPGMQRGNQALRVHPEAGGDYPVH